MAHRPQHRRNRPRMAGSAMPGHLASLVGWRPVLRGAGPPFWRFNYASETPLSGTGATRRYGELQAQPDKAICVYDTDSPYFFSSRRTKSSSRPSQATSMPSTCIVVADMTYAIMAYTAVACILVSRIAIPRDMSVYTCICSYRSIFANRHAHRPAHAQV